MKLTVLAKLASGLTAQILSSAALAGVQSGDQIRCYDSVSNYTYDLKIIDIGDESGSVAVTDGQQEVDFFSEANTSVDFSTDESTGSGIVNFIMIRDGLAISNVEFPDSITADTIVSGTYSDHGDSRDLDCTKTR